VRSIIQGIGKALYTVITLPLVVGGGLLMAATVLALLGAPVLVILGVLWLFGVFG